MADEMIGERDAFEAWWRDWQRGTWDASIDREMPAHWNEDSRSRMELAYQAGRASLAASAGSEPVANRAFLERALSAMESVIDVADRNTTEFDALRSCVVDLTLMLFKPQACYSSPPEGMAGWISVDERLPEPNVEVLCAGQGWGNPFVTACYYDDERREWYPINTHWTDSTGCAQYPTHWQPLPAPPLPASEAKEL